MEETDVVFLEDDRLSRLLPPAVRTVEIALYNITKLAYHPFLQYALAEQAGELGFPSFALDLGSSDHDDDSFELFKKEFVLQLMQWLSVDATASEDVDAWFRTAFRGFVQDPEIQTKVLAVVDYGVLLKQQLEEPSQQQKKLVWATIDEIVLTQQRIATKIAKTTTDWFYLDDSLMWLRTKGTNEQVDAPLTLFLIDRYSEDTTTSNQTMLAEKERNYRYVAEYGPLYLFLTQPVQGLTSMHDRYAVFPGDDCRYELDDQATKQEQRDEDEDEDDEEEDKEDKKQTQSLYFVEHELVTTQVVYGMRTRDRFVLLI